MTQHALRVLWVSSKVRWPYWVPFSAAQDSLEQQLQLEVALSAARDAAAEAGSRQEAAHAEAAELRERVQARLGEASTSNLGVDCCAAGSWSSADHIHVSKSGPGCMIKPSSCCHDPMGRLVASVESQACC
jgi:hypothetical protein